MFKSARWRSDKNRIKAVFKLQFHATQVTQSNVQAMMITVVPGDGGKPTTKSEKATVVEGNCRWENPVYETVKFIREPKTGKINERIYNFILSTGVGKGGLVGEASIDFAAYAETIKTSTVSLPLKNSNSKGILHVSVQRLQENADQRQVEETEDAGIKSQDRGLKARLSNADADESIKNDSVDNVPFSKTAHNVEMHGNHRGYNGSDITISSSDSGSGHNTPRELGIRNDNINQDPPAYLSSVNNTSVTPKLTGFAATTIYEEWSAGSDHGMSTDDSNSSDTFPRENSLHSSDNEVEKLKNELVALSRQVDMSDLELQTLRKQIVKESKRGQDLSREVVTLKDERDVLKLECQNLKTFQKRMDDAKTKSRLHFESADPWVLVEEIKQELSYEKELNSNLRLQLQKTQESNAELILAVQDLEEMLDAKNMEIPNPPNKSGSHYSTEELRGTISIIGDSDEDEEQRALELLVKEHRDSKETSVLEQKIMDLYSEIEAYKRDKDELEAQMEQLALDYEILKQENHDISYKLEQSQLQEQLKIQYECPSSFANINELETQIECLESEFSKQSKEFSDSLVTINELETHIKSLEEELEKQALLFETDLESITLAKVEQEKRAIRAEEALRLTRLKNANTAERLQDEFRRLSMQMASTFDANEKVATNALTEASQLRLQKIQLEELLKRAKEELQSVREDFEAKICDLSNQVNLKSNQIEQMFEEIDDKSKQLEHQKKHEEEVTGALAQEIRSLKAEVDKLTTEKKFLQEQAEQAENFRVELDRTKAFVEETELRMQQRNAERNELLSTIALMRKEAMKLQEELQRMRQLKEEKEAAVESLHLELDILQCQCDKLKQSLLDDEVEKEKQRKQVVQLKSDLKKKEDAFTVMEKKLKENNARVAVFDGTRTNRNNKSAMVTRSPKEVASLREKIKLLEGQIKSKETALESSTNIFLEKEKDLRRKIDELESKVEELNEHSTSFCNQEVKQEVTSNCVTSDGKACISKENGNYVPFVNGTDDDSSANEQKASIVNKDSKQDELMAELAFLKERNNSMENELKDMQERYSEISLKFAEVEGERQKLVMTVRYLKNAKKS